MNKKIEKPPIICIGTGRSGSTYISGAIFSHRELGYPSNYQEMFPSILEINLLRHLFDNPFWRITTRGNSHSFLAKSFFLPSEAYSMWRYLVNDEVDFSRGFLLREKASFQLKNRVEKYFGQMLALQGRDHLAFKITGPSRIGFLLSMFPDAQFLWVKRDFFATLNSFMKINFWKSRGFDKLWFTGGYTTDEISYAQSISTIPEIITAFQLHRVEQLTEIELKKYSPKCLIIDYDDFLINYERDIFRILDFFGLSEDKACYDYIVKNPIKASKISPELSFSDDIVSRVNEIRKLKISEDIFDTLR
jgi:hypothetical protein